VLCTPVQYISFHLKSEEAITLHCQLYLLYSNTNQQLLKKKLSNQSSKITSIMNGSHHMPNTKSTLFAVIKDEWDTKEGTGNSIRMHCMYSSMAKGTSQTEVM